MSTSAQFTFAAEFVAFLAAAAGLALVLLRGEFVVRPPWTRGPLGAGFAFIASAAFLRGSLLVDGPEDAVLALRAGGVLVVAIASLFWLGGGAARQMLWIGLLTLGGSCVAHFQDAVGVGDGLLVLGAVIVLAAVLTASRRSLAARVAGSAAGVLLLMVLVLSLALSAVLSSTVEDEAARRLDARARTEVALLANESSNAILGARLTAQSIATSRAQLLFELASNPQRSGSLDDDLTELSTKFLSGLPLAYYSISGRVLGASGFDPTALEPIAESDAFTEAQTKVAEVSTVAAIRGVGVALGIAPVLADNPQGGRSPLGAVVAARLLDDGYLRQRGADDTSLRLALVTRETRLASVGEQPIGERVSELANRVLSTGQPESTAFSGLFISARPIVNGSGQPVMVLLASTPTTLVDTSRASLFRTLFLIALGGTLLSLLLAALVGERIGARVRRLTEAATSIREGDLSVRAGLGTDDEVGVLGSTFDAMASSLEEQTAALREAADDETRLRNRLEAIVAGMGEALVAVDVRGRVTDFNQAAEELVGVSAASVRGKPAADVVKLVAEEGDDLSPRLREPIARRWSAVANLTPRSGPTVPVAVSAGALRGPGSELAGGVFVLRDLRGERQVERMKTEFLSHVGHELRTPLAGVIGYTELLTRRPLPPEKAKPLQDDILASAKRLERIVEMLEFFAASGAGRVMLRPEDLDIRTIVDDVVHRWSEAAPEGHTITRRVARAVPKVRVDPRWMTRVLDELVDNAIKFSPDGGRVTISAAPSDDGRRVVISVSDRGKGLTAQEQASVFGAFVQGDGSDTRSFGGLGLGLALVQRVTEAHGGIVSVEATPKKGATFSVSLPALPIRRR